MSLVGWGSNGWRLGEHAVQRRPPPSGVDSGDSRFELPGAIVSVGVWFAVVGFGLLAFADVVGYLWFDTFQLRGDGEFTIWSWASSTATSCAALAVGLMAVHERAARRRRATHILLAALLAFFSADDMLQIHEQIHERLQLDFVQAVDPVRIIWPVVYLPLLIVALLLLVHCSHRASGSARRSIRSGLLMLVAAVGCEVISFGLMQWSGTGRATFPYELEVVIEESLELAGWILVACGLLAAFVDRILQAQVGGSQV